MPGLLLFKRLRPNYPKLVVILLAVILLAYISAVTLIRSTVKGTAPSVEDSQISVLDWQAGRFAMIGLSQEMVEKQGLAWGATLYEGLINALNAPFILFKQDPLLEAPRGINSYVGEYLVGDPDRLGIVPGTICEFYYNFGLIGVALGYFLVGKFGQVCIRTMQRTTSPGLFCISSYALVLICTGIIPGTATAWIYHLVTLGFPAVFLFGWELIFKESSHYRHRVQMTQPALLKRF